MPRQTGVRACQGACDGPLTRLLLRGGRGATQVLHELRFASCGRKLCVRLPQDQEVRPEYHQEWKQLKASGGRGRAALLRCHGCGGARVRPVAAAASWLLTGCSLSACRQSCSLGWSSWDMR